MSVSAGRNISALYIIRFSKWFMLYMPLVKLFYEQNGLNNFQLFVLHGVYSLTISLLEIPSGYLADIVGRKKALIFGTLLDFIGFGIYSALSGFWGFLFAEVSLGIGVSFISGSDSAMLYDTLADRKREKDYVRFEGRISAFGNFAETAAGIIVSLLLFAGIHNFRAAYIAQTAVAFFGIPAAILLTDPVSHVRLKHRQFKDIFKIVHFSLFENPKLRNILLFSSVIGFASLLMAWFAQIFFFEIKLREQMYGILWAALNLTTGIGSLLAFKISQETSRIKISAYILILTSAGFLISGMAVTTWALAVLFLLYLVRGVATPVLKDYLNAVTGSSVRATVLSIRSFIIRILFAISGPLLGWISDTINLSTALLMAGSTVFIFGSVLLFIMIKQRPENKQSPD